MSTTEHPAPIEIADSVIEAVATELGDAYDCLRTWRAWSYGTMSANDFALVAECGDRVASIARAAITAYLATQQAAAPAPQAVPAEVPSIEDLCARIKAADDAAADGDYMLDSDDCISVLRGTWTGPLAMDRPSSPPTLVAAPAAPAAELTDDQILKAYSDAIDHGERCNQGHSYIRMQALRAVLALASAPAGEPECSTPTFREAVGGLVYTAHAVVQCPRSVAQRAALERYADLVAGMLADMAAPPASPPPQATAPAGAATVGDDVRDAIGRVLAEVMAIAVSRGANSVSMPDDYVAVAGWLAGLEPPAPAGAMEDARDAAMYRALRESTGNPVYCAYSSEFGPTMIHGAAVDQACAELVAARQAGKGGA